MKKDKLKTFLEIKEILYSYKDTYVNRYTIASKNYLECSLIEFKKLMLYIMDNDLYVTIKIIKGQIFYDKPFVKKFKTHYVMFIKNWGCSLRIKCMKDEKGGNCGLF